MRRLRWVGSVGAAGASYVALLVSDWLYDVSLYLDDNEDKGRADGVDVSTHVGGAAALR